MSVCCGHGIEGKCNEMKAVGNVIWLLFGGVFVAVEYLIGSIGLMLTIVGIPFGLQSLKLVQVALWPFGKSLVPGPAASGCLVAADECHLVFPRRAAYCSYSPLFRLASLHHHRRHSFC